MMSDARILHDYWMDTMYSRHTDPHPVLGKSKPETTSKIILYYLWFLIGVVFVVITYPISYIGIITKVYAVDNILNFVESKGIIRSLILLSIVWLILSVVSYFLQPTETTYAVVAASIIAVLSAIISYITYLTGDDRIKIAIGYPAGYTALLLPPVVFSVLSPVLGQMVLDTSLEVTLFLKENIAEPLGIREFFSNNFDLEGIGHIILWLNISFIVGWITGLSVQLAKIIRDN